MPALMSRSKSMLLRRNVLKSVSSSTSLLAGALFGLGLSAGCASLPVAVPVLEPRLSGQPEPAAYHRSGRTSAEVEAEARSCHEVANKLVLGESPLALEPTHSQSAQLDDLASQCMEKRGYARGVQLAAAESAPSAAESGTPAEEAAAGSAAEAAAESAAPAAAAEAAVSAGEEEADDGDEE